MPHFLSTLRVRLLLLVLAAALPGVGLNVYDGLEQQELASAAVEQNALRLAREISREHERYIEGARQLLTSLVRLPEVQKLQANRTGAFFADILRQFPIYTNLGAAKPNGDLFASGLPLKAPLNIADRPYFQQLLKTRDFTISEYQIGRLSGKPNITIAYPAVDKSGAVQAVVFVGLSLDWFERFLVALQLPNGAVVTLRGHDGTVITRYPDPEKWIGRPAAGTPVFKAILSHEGEGTVTTPGLDGVRHLYGFTTLRALGLGGKIYVSVGIPEEITFAEVKKSFYLHLSLMAAVLSISIALVWFGAGLFITRPVEELVGATRRLAAGDLSARTGMPHGASELAQLAYSFDQMAESLEQNITERKRAEEELRQNLARIQALREIDRAITSTLDLDAVLNVLLEKIDHFLPYPVAIMVRLWNQQTGELEFFTCRNLDKDEWKAQDARSRGGRAKVVFETQQPLVVRNVHTDPRTWEPEFFRKHGLVSYLGVPLMAKGKPLGVLSLYTLEECQFSEEEIDFLSTLACQAAIAIENSQFYERIKNQAEELKKAVAEMEIANKVKDEFLSVMSHELRTPLNVVLGYTGMLRDGMLGEIPPRQKEVLSKVILRAGDLLTLIRDILQATQIESRSVIVDLHLVNLVDLLDRLKAGYEQPLDKELTMKWDYPADLPPVITDSEKLKQILQNLIHNAIKFTEKGHVTISARMIENSRQKAERSREEAEILPTAHRLLPTSRQWVEFKVADTGIGIPKETFLLFSISFTR